MTLSIWYWIPGVVFYNSIIILLNGVLFSFFFIRPITFLVWFVYSRQNWSPVSIQTQFACVACVPSIPIGWRLRMLRQPRSCSVEAVATMIGCLPTQALAFLAVFVYATHATHATQAIAFEWKPGLTCTSAQVSRHPFMLHALHSQLWEARRTECW